MSYRILFVFALAFIPLVSPAQKRVEVKDPEISFSYILPASWLVKDDGYTYEIVAPERQDAYISITYVETPQGTEYIESLGEKPSFEEDFFFEIRYILSEDFSNLKVLENGNTKIDGTTARWVKFSHGSNADKTGVFYMYQKLNQTFKITATSPTEQFEKAQPIFNSVVNSFKAEMR